MRCCLFSVQSNILHFSGITSYDSVSHIVSLLCQAEHSRREAPAPEYEEEREDFV